MLLADVVATSVAVAATTKRTQKVAALAALVSAATVDEVAVIVGLLTGEARQGRIGVGWATASAIGTGGASDPTVTVAELDAVLDRIAGTTGAGSVGDRAGILSALAGRATAAEVDFLRRLLTGELRQGALDGLMADAVARAAGVPLDALRRAAMLTGDLGEAARLARAGGAEALAAVGLTVLRAVQPMLASPAADVAAALGETGEASVEWKLDGARIQVHRAGDDVRVFTRNLNDVTARLPLVVAAARALPVATVVLDGEALGLGGDGRPRRFQDTMSRFGADEDRPHGDLHPFFFDVLHHDGADLLERPLVERLAVLEAVAPTWRVPALRTAEPGMAAAFLADALAAGHEGVVVKALGSTYEAGRRGGAWRKVKPVRTLDLVVLAAEWGHGRRTGWLSNLHLGARGPYGGFVMVGKTFKGLTDELLRWQTTELGRLATAGTDDWVVPVRPELVVEVALDGVQVSRRYPGGVALRFARVRAYRPDKSAAEADTIEAVRALLG
jgi:DNA ligase-1